MRGSWRAVPLLAALMLVAGACDFFGGSTSQTASTSPRSTPSTTTSNPVTVSPPSTAPSPVTTPSTAGLAVTSPAVHNGEVGVIYLAVTFQATGGTAPYTWAANGGVVP